MKVKRLLPEAILPTRAHDTDAGYDLYARKEAVVTFGHITRVPTGVAVEIPGGCAGLIWPRSGHARKAGVDVLAGVVDPGYRGEVVVLLTKTTPGLLELPADSAVAQLLVQPVHTPPVEEVDEFAGSTLRGSAGFGSTDRRFVENVRKKDY